MSELKKQLITKQLIDLIADYTGLPHECVGFHLRDFCDGREWDEYGECLGCDTDESCYCCSIHVALSNLSEQLKEIN